MLTDQSIRALKPKPVRYLVTDGEGLCIEVLPTGKLSWVFRYRHNGKPEKVMVGRYPDMSLKLARQRRRELATEVAQGKSPASQKKELRRAASAQPTVREFAERYYREIVIRDRKDPSMIRGYLDRDLLPVLGDRAIGDVLTGDIQTIVFRKRDGGHPAAAGQLRSLAKRMFDYAVASGALTQNPAAAIPRRYITNARSRDRNLAASEVRIYLQTLYQSNIRRQFKLGLHLILLTLVRKSELLLARWDQVNLDAKEWTIPAAHSKTGRPHVIYLSRQAVGLFEELRRLSTGSELVMPGRGSLKKPFASNALNRAMDGISFDIPAFTIHDLRRTGSTLLHEKGFSSDVVEKALNHTLGGVRGVYNRAEFAEQRRKMLQFWGDYVESLANESNILVGNFGAKSA